MEYVFYFGITLAVSTLFSIGGVGSSVALIPILSFLGVGFDIAKAVGLFANTASTIGASIMNVLRKSIDVKQVLPFVSMSVACAPLGAYSATQMDTYYAKFFFALFLFFSATMMLRQKKKRHYYVYESVGNGTDGRCCWFFERAFRHWWRSDDRSFTYLFGIRCKTDGNNR